jgi:FKBP-type peptidyl-prolyl cis-trans isomerase FkpA
LRLKPNRIMSKIKFYFILLIATITVISCNDNDSNDTEITPPKPYAEQYKIDIDSIEGFLKTNYIYEVVNKPGLPEDQDVIIKKIPDGGTQPSLWSYLDSPTLPRLTSRNVSATGITYKFYTLVIREGVKGGSTSSGSEYPCNVDGVYAGYKGTLLNGAVFDSSNNGQILYNLDGSPTGGGIPVIRGWSEGFPQFRTGWTSSNPDGTILYNDFGVGVMFVPSGLGYYNKASENVPSYSCLVFSVKLYVVRRYDQDADGIPSYQEDLDGDRYMNYFAKGVDNLDDTDKDGIPNFGDFDDDGDNYATRGEVKDKNGNYYPFALIPDCDGDQTKPDRLKRHLDEKCTKMSQ